MENEISIIPFIIEAKNSIDYLEINLTKDVEKLYIENYSTLLKVIKDLNKWRENVCSEIRRLHIVKMSLLPQISL